MRQLTSNEATKDETSLACREEMKQRQRNLYKYYQICPFELITLRRRLPTSSLNGTNISLFMTISFYRPPTMECWTFDAGNFIFAFTILADSTVSSGGRYDRLGQQLIINGRKVTSFLTQIDITSPVTVEREFAEKSLSCLASGNNRTRHKSSKFMFTLYLRQRNSLPTFTSFYFTSREILGLSTLDSVLMITLQN